MPRIVKEPDERKRELIEAAERLFIAQGWEQTSICDIVREVSVSQGAFYYYYVSKEDVLVAVIEKKIALHRKLMKVRPFAGIAPLIAGVISKGCEKGRFDVVRPLETSFLLLMMNGYAYHMFHLNETFRESNYEDFRGSNYEDPDNNELKESMRIAMEDLIARALGVCNYRFVLKGERYYSGS